VKDDCIFCKIARREVPATIVAEDEQAMAFNDAQPKAPLHVLVIPRRHIVSLAEADDAALIGHLVKLATKIAKDGGYAARGFRVVSNTGREGGQAVDHLHFHVLAGRPLGAPWSPWER
jgi:histidine triad (HIT) family protein